MKAEPMMAAMALACAAALAARGVGLKIELDFVDESLAPKPAAPSRMSHSCVRFDNAPNSGGPTTAASGRGDVTFCNDELVPERGPW